MANASDVELVRLHGTPTTRISIEPMRNTLATLLLALALAPVGATATAPAAPSVAPVAIDGVDWFRGELFAIRAKAKAEGKGVLFVVHSQDSSWCKKLFQTTLQDAGVLVELEDLVCVEVDLSRDEEGSVIDVTSEQIAARFPEIGRAHV